MHFVSSRAKCVLTSNERPHARAWFCESTRGLERTARLRGAVRADSARCTACVLRVLPALTPRRLPHGRVARHASARYVNDHFDKAKINAEFVKDRATRTAVRARPQAVSLRACAHASTQGTCTHTNTNTHCHMTTHTHTVNTHTHTHTHTVNADAHAHAHTLQQDLARITAAHTLDLCADPHPARRPHRARTCCPGPGRHAPHCGGRGDLLLLRRGLLARAGHRPRHGREAARARAAAKGAGNGTERGALKRSARREERVVEARGRAATGRLAAVAVRAIPPTAPSVALGLDAQAACASMSPRSFATAPFNCMLVLQKTRRTWLVKQFDLVCVRNRPAAAAAARAPSCPLISSSPPSGPPSPQR